MKVREGDRRRASDDCALLPTALRTGELERPRGGTTLPAAAVGGSFQEGKLCTLPRREPATLFARASIEDLRSGIFRKGTLMELVTRLPIPFCSGLLPACALSLLVCGAAGVTYLDDGVSALMAALVGFGVPCDRSRFASSGWASICFLTVVALDEAEASTISDSSCTRCFSRADLDPLKRSKLGGRGNRPNLTFSVDVEFGVCPVRC